MYTVDELLAILTIIAPFAVIGVAATIGIVVSFSLYWLFGMGRKRINQPDISEHDYQTGQKYRGIIHPDSPPTHRTGSVIAQRNARALINRHLALGNKRVKFLVPASAVSHVPGQRPLIHQLSLLSGYDVDIVFIYDLQYHPSEDLEKLYADFIKELDMKDIRCDRLIRAKDNVVMSAELSTSIMLVGMYSDDIVCSILTELMGMLGVIMEGRK